MFVFRSILAAALAVIIGGVVVTPAAHAAAISGEAIPSATHAASIPADVVRRPGAGAPASAADAMSPSTAPAAGIPDEALLRPADLGGAGTREAGADSWPALRPPRPCGLRAPKPVADRAVSAVVDADRAPVVVMEYVALLPAGGAERYLHRLRAAVRNCPDWRLEKAGTGTLTVRWTQTWEHVDEQVTHHTYLTIARSGRAIVLVADLGWETSSGERARVERLITPATRRAAVLR